jgi:hypothetical protein
MPCPSDAGHKADEMSTIGVWAFVFCLVYTFLDILYHLEAGW